MIIQVLEIAFWVSLIGVLHTYVLFPLLMSLLARFKNQGPSEFSQDELPHIDIILAVYNEEKVIEQKIISTFNTNYPLDKITFYIGSDCSSDQTNPLVEKYLSKYPAIKFTPFQTRTGKAGIVNQLFDKSTAPILIFTDANVFFEQNTIYELVKQYKDPQIGVVSANIINEEHKKKGISFQEKKYLELEKQLKHNEGEVWGTMIGAFGGCYSIRRECFRKVPPTFLMDDFYISMNAFVKKQKAILNLDAVCYEDVSDKMSEEFRRKIRISAGNFQNLVAYRSLFRNPFSKIAFTFWSHKVLRWITPFFLLIMLISSIFLSTEKELFKFFLYGQLSLILITFAEIMLNRININVRVLRFLTHFLGMNLALFLGFFKFLFGVKTNVWKPTERFQ